MKKLVLHLGAHRCGSTAIQSLLRREHSVLADEGIAVFLRADMSAGGFDLRRLHRYRRANPLWQSKLKKTARTLEAMPQQTVLVSEENIMGTMPAVRSHRFYPHFSNLVQSLVKLAELGREPLSIAPRLVVRRQDHYLESVYAFRVARGLALSFDDFIKTATKTRTSWLRLAQALNEVSNDAVKPKIAVLEDWPKPRSADKALEFLLGTNDITLSNDRLTGNIRRTAADLKLTLALNRAKIKWRDAAWAQEILDNSSEQDAVGRLKDCLKTAEFQCFETHYSQASKLGFDDAERAEFIATYSEENSQLFAMDMFSSDGSAWSRP